MIQNVFIPSKSFVFPTTQRLFLPRWFKLFSWLCYSLIEDGAYCLPCICFAGKKNTAAKSFIFKPFKHWPDRMGAFKRHIDPEHGVHNKCMFDYDQPISRLKGKSVSIDLSVNSVGNEKVLNNRKIISAIIDTIKLCGQPFVNLENHLKTCSTHETYLSATTQNDLLKCCYQVIMEGLLKEVKN